MLFNLGMETWDNGNKDTKPLSTKYVMVASQSTSPDGEPFRKPPDSSLAYADRLAHRPACKRV